MHVAWIDAGMQVFRLKAQGPLQGLQPVRHRCHDGCATKAALPLLTPATTAAPRWLPYPALPLPLTPVAPSCSERDYDPAKFYGRVAKYPFDDHNAPPFLLLKPFCDDVHKYLCEDERYVAGMPSAMPRGKLRCLPRGPC